MYRVLLDQTAFFPEGGGQPADEGTLDGIFVTDVQEIDGEIWHTVEAPLEPGKTVVGKLDFEKLANHSIVQTLQRSINTQLMTVEFLLLALALFGGITLREFAVILLVGLLSGTYSSIFVAAPLLVVWEKKEWKTWFHKGETASA